MISWWLCCYKLFSVNWNLNVMKISVLTIYCSYDKLFILFSITCSNSNGHFSPKSLSETNIGGILLKSVPSVSAWHENVAFLKPSICLKKIIDFWLYTQGENKSISCQAPSTFNKILWGFEIFDMSRTDVFWKNQVKLFVFGIFPPY